MCGIISNNRQNFNTNNCITFFFLLNVWSSLMQWDVSNNKKKCMSSLMFCLLWKCEEIKHRFCSISAGSRWSSTHLISQISRTAPLFLFDIVCRSWTFKIYSLEKDKLSNYTAIWEYHSVIVNNSYICTSICYKP